MKKESINLIENYQLSEKQRKGKGSRALNAFAVFFVTILLLSAYSLTLYLQDTNLKESNQELQSYISNASIIDQIKVISVKQRQLTDLNEILAELRSLNAAFEVMPRLNSTLFDLLYSTLPPDTKIQTIDFDGQWFTIITSSPNILRPSEYARNLRNTDYFENVVYDGYAADNTGKTVYIGAIKVALRIGQ
jgi:Tfp pilus assembly protein PilN